MVLKKDMLSMMDKIKFWKVNSVFQKHLVNEVKKIKKTLKILMKGDTSNLENIIKKQNIKNFLQIVCRIML